MSRSVLLLVHILAATIWTGGHLVLATTVLPRAMRAKDASIVHDFEEGFEKLGIPALIAQVITGVWMGLQWFSTAAQWTNTGNPVARALLLKLALLAVTVALAAHARLRVLPNLTADRLRLLAWHIIPVTVISTLFVIVGVTLRTGGI